MASVTDREGKNMFKSVNSYFWTEIKAISALRIHRKWEWALGNLKVMQAYLCVEFPNRRFNAAFPECSYFTATAFESLPSPLHGIVAQTRSATLCMKWQIPASSSNMMTKHESCLSPLPHAMLISALYFGSHFGELVSLRACFSSNPQCNGSKKDQSWHVLKQFSLFFSNLTDVIDNITLFDFFLLEL